MLKVKLNHLLIAAIFFVATLSPLQLLADTVLPQYSDDVHLGVHVLCWQYLSWCNKPVEGVYGSAK